MGDGARGLLRGRQCLEVLPLRTRPRPGLPLERGRLGGPERSAAGHLPFAVVVERQGPDPQGAPVRPRQPPGQSRRGCQGVLLVHRRDPIARLDALSLPLPAGRIPVRGLAHQERRARPHRAGVRTHRHRHLRRGPVLGGRRRLRQGHPDGHQHPHHRDERRTRRGNHRRAADDLVPQHVGVGPRTPGAGNARRRRHDDGHPLAVGDVSPGSRTVA